jgi:hypothetical protein
VGGAIVQAMSWQWIFWLNVPVGIALVPLARTRLAETRGPAVRLDLPGLSLSAVGLFTIVWELVGGNSSAQQLRAFLGTLDGKPAGCWASVMPALRLKPALGHPVRDCRRIG